MELMLILEERLKTLDFVDRFKLSLVSHDPQEWVRRMWPDWVPDSTDPSPDGGEDDFDLADTEGTWVFEEEITPEQAEAAFAEVLSERGGTISWDDLGADDEGWM